ncbi:hypothetical protein TPHA_0D02780 [Tetrapisispora phaffii CBS 4417]|uniref:Mitochondrial fusion and transport protein UGO1 n=1 Tax=Tetrapisispora phaffii (strain ATCC 24235 / CBS 4417 / NBRC 1672 / NRRL Y-8282 / UCD 70-5) TaxID=1071381 RepID=G8BSU3_TETPH|nr:hypothetical protein TPHA_0D02780 [Tetrapisispora phaffii CBS 4417]CCE62914.1 hypothetical protein TPHA_0D02780 [Tetrapisispora phaffii CBS 4417]
MNEEIIRSQARPYYEPDTFDAGYSAVFRPDKGVVDPYGFNIASKLKIVQSNNGGLADLKNVSKSNGILWNFIPKWFTWSSHNNKNINKLSSSNKILLSDTDQNINKNLDALEWPDLLDIDVGKRILNQLLGELTKMYLRHLVQQPFEVSKVLLQVGDFTSISAENNRNKFKDSSAENPGILLEDQENDTDAELEFFSKKPINASNEVENKKAIKGRVGKTDKVIVENRINPESLHIMDIINSLIEKEGLRGVWRANNTTFIYNFLNMTCNIWFIGLLSPFFGISDPHFFDTILQTATSYSTIDDIKISLGLTICSNILTNILLVPLDLIKIKLITTSIEGFTVNKDIDTEFPAEEVKELEILPIEKSRSLRNIIKSWSWKEDLLKLPADIWFFTILNSLVSINRSSSTVFGEKLFTLLWVHYLRQTKESSKLKLYNLSFCCFQILGIFLKLPIETILHRCQVKYLLNRNKEREDQLCIRSDELIIKPIPYDNGLFDNLITNSTTSDEKENNLASKKIKALWNGWRISVVSLLCDYSLKVLQKNDKSIEFEF